MSLSSVIAGFGLLDVATFGIVNLIATDVLVRRLYFSTPNVWESIGKPVGPRWTPPGTTTKDTLTIFERRLSISELFRRISKISGATDAMNIANGYYRIHKISLVMIAIGVFCFVVGLVASFV